MAEYKENIKKLKEKIKEKTPLKNTDDKTDQTSDKENTSDKTEEQLDEKVDISDETNIEISNSRRLTLSVMTILVVVFAVFSIYVYFLWNPPFNKDANIEGLQTELYTDGSETCNDEIVVTRADEGSVLLQKKSENGKWETVDKFKLKNGKATITYPAHDDIYTNWRIKTPKFQSYLKMFNESSFDVQMTSYNTQKIRLNSDYACIIDQNGKVIYNKNADVQQEIGSITKLMTYLVASDKLIPSDRTIVSHEAASTEYASLSGIEDEIITIKNLYIAMLLESSNDAAVAIAEEAAGSHELFVDLMNKKADELGLDDTIFKNANGLDQSGQISSAHSACVLMKECFESELFRKIEKDNETYIESETGTYWFIDNTNMLIDSYKVRAAKTETKKKAGYCLSFVYQRGSKYYYITTLGGDSDADRWDDAYTLMNYIDGTTSED